MPTYEMADEDCPPCCPPTRTPLALNKLSPNAVRAKPTDKGAMKTFDGQEAYTTGSAANKFGILVAAGAGGFVSGKTRAVIDEIAEKTGSYAVMPRMHSPGIDGGEDGDGLPENFDFEKNFKRVNPWMMGFPWDTVTQPKVAKALKHLQDMGCTKVAGIGFCWGGWCMIKTLNMPEAKGLMVCAVSFHPALHLEQMFKGDTLALCGTAIAPMLLMPAKDDLAIKMKGNNLYDKDTGAISVALKKSQPQTEVIHFPEMVHGWVSNGDLKDAAVARDSQIAIDEASKYMSRMFGGAKM